jgi:hypothetical protein
MDSRAEKAVTYVLSSMSVIGFLMQALSEKNFYVQYIGFAVVGVTIVAALAQSIATRSVVGRNTVIRRGKKVIREATSKVVLFGGDISWADDYLRELKEASDEGDRIEVIYPMEKYNSLIGKAKEDFDQRAETLRAIGARVCPVKLDSGLRCILVDPDTDMLPNHLKIHIANRLYKHPSRPEKSRYQTRLLAYDNLRERDLCAAYLSHYRIAAAEVAANDAARGKRNATKPR